VFYDASGLRASHMARFTPRVSPPISPLAPRDGWRTGPAARGSSSPTARAAAGPWSSRSERPPHLSAPRSLPTPVSRRWRRPSTAQRSASSKPSTFSLKCPSSLI